MVSKKKEEAKARLGKYIGRSELRMMAGYTTTIVCAAAMSTLHALGVSYLALDAVLVLGIVGGMVAAPLMLETY